MAVELLAVHWTLLMFTLKKSFFNMDTLPIVSIEKLVEMNLLLMVTTYVHFIIVYICTYIAFQYIIVYMQYSIIYIRCTSTAVHFVSLSC